MTKKLFSLLLILLTAFSISAQTRTDKLLKNLHDNKSKYIFVIAHRGDWRNAPENSLQSIEKAIAMKVDMVELDIQPTKDGNFICMHDETLDRTSTGKGTITNYTTEELRPTQWQRNQDPPTNSHPKGGIKCLQRPYPCQYRQRRDLH